MWEPGGAIGDSAGSAVVQNSGLPAMNQVERFYRIDQLLQDRGTVAFQALQDELEVSRATLRRDLTYMRDRLHAPIVYDPDAGGYRYEAQQRGSRHQLPGVWFTSEEVFALLTMHELLDSLDTGGLLGPHIRPLLARLEALLGTASAPAKEMLRRIKIMPLQHRRTNVKWFEVIGAALVTRRRLRLDYFSRHRGERAEREVSPLRLMHYRNNWYLDAWCHRSDAIRMFSLDAIENAAILQTRAKDVPLAKVDAELGAGYGIYRTAKLVWGKLRFNADAARWVRDEVWHEEQKIENLPDGGLLLTVPFSHPSELVMDILRHGENVEVLGPKDLRDTVRKRLGLALQQYCEG